MAYVAYISRFCIRLALTEPDPGSASTSMKTYLWAVAAVLCIGLGFVFRNSCIQVGVRYNDLTAEIDRSLGDPNRGRFDRERAMDSQIERGNIGLAIMLGIGISLGALAVRTATKTTPGDRCPSRSNSSP